MNRDKLIDAGVQALSDTMRRAGDIVRGHIVDDALADLRAKVQALPEDAVLYRGNILALIDEISE